MRRTRPRTPGRSPTPGRARTRTACLLTALLAAAALGPAAAAADPLVDNGDFTRPPLADDERLRIGGFDTLPGWGVSRGDVDLYGSGLARLDGAQAVGLTGSGNGTIGQVPATVPGTTYELSWQDSPDTWPGERQEPGRFDPEKRSCLGKSPGDQAYQVAVSGTRARTFRPAGDVTTGGPGWSPQRLVFTAGEGDTHLRFISQADPQHLPHCGPLVTHVTLRPLPAAPPP